MDPTERFRRLVEGSAASSLPTLVDDALKQVVCLARAAWPEIALSDQVFFDFLAQKIAPGQDLLALLPSLHTSDLYLACACLLGDAKAMDAIERHYLSQLGASSLAVDAHSGFLEELKQTLRERVFVARPGEPPRLSSYNGRGPLAGWLRMVAARLAVDLRKKQRGAAAVADARELAVPVVDLELQYLKERYRLEFEDAIQEAFHELPARERAILRLHYLDRIPVASIATMYQVSSRTVQRWIAAAHAEVKARVRRTLARKFALTERELESLLGLVISQLSVTLQTL
jgi:RNA polymerase sigma-70 factor (ECF subfamily)